MESRTRVVLRAGLVFFSGAAFSFGVLGLTSTKTPIALGLALLVSSLVLVVSSAVIGAGAGGTPIEDPCIEKIRQGLAEISEEVARRVVSELRTNRGGFPSEKDEVVAPETQAKGRAFALIALGTLLATTVVLIVAVLLQVNRARQNYSSPYDGQDPQVSKCAESAEIVAGDSHPQLIGDDGRPIGHIELRRSAVCATVWAKVSFTTEAAPHLVGRQVEITMRRPGDNATAPVSLALRGSPERYGNQLGDQASCVRAEVKLRPGNGEPGGQAAVTICR
jgi:hypothetical protein